MQSSRHVTVQQQQIRRQLGPSNAFTFFNILTGPDLFEPLEALLPAHRERRFPPTETLAMFLHQALSEDRSCQRAVNDTAMARVAGNLPRCSTHTGAYCRARQRLPTALITALGAANGWWELFGMAAGVLLLTGQAILISRVSGINIPTWSPRTNVTNQF